MRGSKAKPLREEGSVTVRRHGIARQGVEDKSIQIVGSGYIRPFRVEQTRSGELQLFHGLQGDVLVRPETNRLGRRIGGQVVDEESHHGVANGGRVGMAARS